METFVKLRISIVTLLAAGLLSCLAAQAQTTAKPAAKATKPATKAPAGKAAAKKAAPAEPPLAQADAEQMTAAGMTLVGDYACEFDQAVKVGATPMHDGYVDVNFKGQNWTMKPVLSSTGALRLEDVKGRMLMLQIANKSMLMDAKAGQRVVDGCVHEKQRLFTAAAAGQAPADGLLQGPTAASAPR